MAQAIDCGEEITIEDVKKLKSKMNEAFVYATNILITKTQRWVLKHAEITILVSDEVTYSLYAGEKTNQFAVFYDKADGLVKTARRESGWWLWLYDTCDAAKDVLITVPILMIANKITSKK